MEKYTAEEHSQLRELDMRIAKASLGWRKEWDIRKAPRYTVDTRYALSLLAEIADLGYEITVFREDGLYAASIDALDILETAPTLPLAISLAFHAFRAFTALK